MMMMTKANTLNVFSWWCSSVKMQRRMWKKSLGCKILDKIFRLVEKSSIYNLYLIFFLNNPAKYHSSEIRKSQIGIRRIFGRCTFLLIFINLPLEYTYTQNTQQKANKNYENNSLFGINIELFKSLEFIT